MAFVEGPGVDELIRDGQLIKAGDDFLEVIHTPGHSSDSICLYAAQAQAVFSGDTQLKIRQAGAEYPAGYLEGVERLAGRKIGSIFSGHDEPITDRVQELLINSVAVLKGSRTTTGGTSP